MSPRSALHHDSVVEPPRGLLHPHDQFLRGLGLEHLEPGCVEMGARTPEDLKLCTDADFTERGIGLPIERRKLLASLKKI